MFFGLILLKLIPMEIYGKDIKFDASAHITIVMFLLYFIWFFIDQNKSWRTIYFVFSLAVISIVSIQRILVDAHNDIGLLGGLLLSLVAIVYSQRKYFKNKFKF
jgi:membrane-associated phospholipid phosphatase